MKIAQITWSDSNRYQEQIEKDYFFDLVTITSVGIVITEDEDVIVITQDIIGDDVRGVLVIAKQNIENIKYLEMKG